MKDFKLTDLTPEIMQKIEKLTSPDEVIRFLNENGIHISADQAADLLAKLCASLKLGEDKLGKVAGGVGDEDPDDESDFAREMAEVDGRSTGTTWVGERH